MQRRRPSPHPRAQGAVGTLLLMLVCSPGLVWNSLSLDPVVAMPGMALLLLYLNLLLSVGQGTAAIQVALENLSGCSLGAGLAIGLTYAVWAINGQSRDNTFTRVSSGEGPCGLAGGSTGKGEVVPRRTRRHMRDACLPPTPRVSRRRCARCACRRRWCTWER